MLIADKIGNYFINYCNKWFLIFRIHITLSIIYLILKMKNSIKKKLKKKGSLRLMSAGVITCPKYRDNSRGS